MSGNSPWPDLPFAAWSETCDTLQLWTQIAGKVCPRAHAAGQSLVERDVSRDRARACVAPAIPYQGRTFDIVFDFIDHRLDIEASDGRSESLSLRPMAVADFYAEFMARLAPPRHRRPHLDHAV